MKSRKVFAWLWSLGSAQYYEIEDSLSAWNVAIIALLETSHSMLWTKRPTPLDVPCYS